MTQGCILLSNSQINNIYNTYNQTFCRSFVICYYLRCRDQWAAALVKMPRKLSNKWDICTTNMSCPTSIILSTTRCPSMGFTSATTRPTRPTPAEWAQRQVNKRRKWRSVANLASWKRHCHATWGAALWHLHVACVHCVYATWPARNVPTQWISLTSTVTMKFLSKLKIENAANVKSSWLDTSFVAL